MTYVEYYNTYKSDKDHIDNALKYLVDYNHISKKFGDEKLETGFNLKMESNQPTFFIPTMMYTFMYASPDKQNVNGVQFIDNIPLIMVLDFSDSTVLGLNFNFIPNVYRAAVLDIIDETNRNFYTAILGDDTFKLNDAFVNAVSTERNRKAFVELINTRLNVNISSAYRLYKIKYCQNIRMIEYDMWKYIPFLSFGDTVREAKIEELQRNVLQKK